MFWVANFFLAPVGGHLLRPKKVAAQCVDNTKRPRLICIFLQIKIYEINSSDIVSLWVICPRLISSSIIQWDPMFDSHGIRNIFFKKRTNLKKSFFK